MSFWVLTEKIGKACRRSNPVIFFFFAVQKLSALSASLARVVSSAEEEEAELDQFPTEGVRKPNFTQCLFEYTENKILVS